MLIHFPNFFSIIFSQYIEGFLFFSSINFFKSSKEKTVTDFIKETYNNYNIICDKTIKNGCSKKRPDLLIDLHTHVIIIEIDEEQHNRYELLCENKRIMEISQDLGHPNVVFIRFNPDSYNNNNNKKINSCWTISSSGLSIIKKNYKKKWKERLDTLKKEVTYWIENIPDKHINIKYLYYDGYSN